MLTNKKILLDILKTYKDKSICLAYSGGVDSCLLLALLKELNIDVLAVTFKTTLHPKSDIDFASYFAKQLNAKHQVITINEFENQTIMQNTTKRCYHCKKLLFSTLKEYGLKQNIDIILDGTNYDDLSEYRPGLTALKELNIISPLALAKLTKSEIREYAKSLGLEVSNKPSTPCMATRLPYNDLITKEKLNIIEKSEEYLKSLGFIEVRVRCHNFLARIEIPFSYLELFLENKTKITNQLKKIGFDFVTLDLEGLRSGSFDKAKNLKMEKL